MNSPIHAQLVKWTVPAVAFVIALFWYRRHRIDRLELERNDPGGDVELKHENNTILDDCMEIDTSHHDSNVQEETSQSSADCNSAEEQEEELTRVPTKTSESMEMDIRYGYGYEFYNPHELMFDDGNNVDPAYLNVSYQLNAVGQNVFQDNGNEQILYYQTQPSQQQYIANEYSNAGNNQQVEEHTEDTINEYNYAGDSQQVEKHTEDTINEYNYAGDSQQVKEHTEDTINTQGQVCERDSANHSPLSVGAPERTLTPEETLSEGSMDSGKGGSINDKGRNNIAATYDFAIPQELVGRLIGRHGSFLHSIRTKTNVAIYVHDHPYDDDHKICSIQGNTDEIDVALKMIRQKFPEKKFPQVTLAEISTVVPEVIMESIPYVPRVIQLTLIQKIHNDVCVSHIVKPNWLFLNLPTHPTYPCLQNLETEMMYYYENNESKLPSVLDVNRGDYVAVKWEEKWVRACVQKVDSSKEKHVVKLVDHGGYWIFGSKDMKPLIPSFLELPFQAIEIFLANIRPKNGIWESSTYDLVNTICNSGVGKADVAGYIADKVYIILYYPYNNYGVFSLAAELVRRDLAEPIEWEQMRPEPIEPIFPK